MPLPLVVMPPPFAYKMNAKSKEEKHPCPSLSMPC
jgi:hypothetical protein